MIHQLLNRCKLASSMSHTCALGCCCRTVNRNRYMEFMATVKVTSEPNTRSPISDNVEKHKNSKDKRTSGCDHVGGIYFEDFSKAYPLLDTPPAVEIISGQLDGASDLPFQPQYAKPTIAISTTRASGRNHTCAAPPTPIASRKGSTAPSVRKKIDSVQKEESSTHMVYRPSSFNTSKPLTAARLGAMIRELDGAEENKNPNWAVTYNLSPQHSSPAVNTPEECAYDCEAQSLTEGSFQIPLSQAATEYGNGSVETQSLSKDVISPLTLPSPCLKCKRSGTQERKKYIPIIAVKPLPKVRPVISLDGHLILDYSRLDGKCDCAKEILLERTRKLPHWFAFKAEQYLTTDPLSNCEKCTKWLGIDHSQRLLLKRVSLTTTDVNVRPSQLAAAVGIIRRYSGTVNSAKVDFPPDIGLYTKSDIRKLGHCLKTLQETLPFSVHIQVRRQYDNPKLGERWRRVGGNNFCEVVVRWIKQDIKNVSSDVRKGVRVEMPSYYL